MFKGKKKKIFKGILIVFLMALGFLVIQNEITARKYSHILDAKVLSEKDKKGIIEVKKIKEELGNEIWPGFKEKEIPIILYNDKYEFLYADKSPDSYWEIIEGKGDNNKYFRRAAVNSQAFAVKTGDVWTGSIGNLQKMNKDYFLGIRSELPYIPAKLFPYQFAIMTEDIHTVVVIHEMFHGFQAVSNEEKLLKAEASHSALKTYPYGDEGFRKQWNEEGGILSKALKAKDKNETKELLKEFVKRRDERRTAANLNGEAIEAEKKLEWLEGLAKYTEIKAHELAAERDSGNFSYNYKKGLTFWRGEFNKLKHGLGNSDGDYRFYLSGMAQARILDKLGVQWKDKMMEDGVYLEDEVEEFLKNN